MSKAKIQLYDGVFEHTFPHVGYYTASNYDMPKKVEWVKNDPPHDLAVFTETHLDMASTVSSKIKIAWIVESKGIHPWAYEKIKELEDNFDYILVNDKELVSRSEKYHQIYVGASRINQENIDKKFNKNKLVSLIASHKTMTPGHILRHEIARKQFSIDLWGSAYKPFLDKVEPLGDYMYSIVILNAKYDYYFNEALMDCFMHKAIPIFWGCPGIGDIFDARGIYLFNDIEELKTILDKISFDDYNSRLKYINKNYKIVKDNFMITDDIIANKIKEILK